MKKTYLIIISFIILAIPLYPKSFWEKLKDFITLNPIHIKPTSIPIGKINRPYSVQFIASGGVAPYTWSVNSLPVNFTLSSIGYLSGETNLITNYTSIIKTTDSRGKSKNLTIYFAICRPLTITTTSIPNGTVKIPYSAQLNAKGGVKYINPPVCNIP